MYIQCVNLPENSYKCLFCPNGFRDSDGGCIDIKECEEFSSCDTELGVKCTNTVSTSSSPVEWLQAGRVVYRAVVRRVVRAVAVVVTCGNIAFKNSRYR